MYETVIITGAGASKEYGFPLGSELRRDIIQTDLEKMKPYYEHIHGNIQDFLAFRDAFNSSRVSSIDLFVKHNPKYAMHAKRAIVSCINYDEYYHSKTPVDEIKSDWLGFLYNKLLQSMPKNEKPDVYFNNLPITFVTYNYDRLIEYYFKTALRNTFPECDIRHFIFPRVHHVYGSLGSLDDIQYGKRAQLNLDDYCKSLHLMEEREKNYSELQEIILAADRVHILGFGFDKTNVEVLDIVRTCSEAIVGRTRYVYATGFGLLSEEHDAYQRLYFKSRYDHPIIDLPDCDCLKLLRKHFQ